MPSPRARLACDFGALGLYVYAIKWFSLTEFAYSSMMLLFVFCSQGLGGILGRRRATYFYQYH